MSSARARPFLIRVALAALVLFGMVLLFGRSGANTLVAQLVGGMRGMGWAAYPLYGLVYVPVSLLMLPASPMTVGAGYLFGWWPGVAVGSVASVVASAAAVQVGRTLGRPIAVRLAQVLPRFHAISAAVEKHGFEVVALLRVTPLVPFPLLNYVLGLTRLSLARFALATVVGMFPGIVVYAYIGSRATEIADVLARPHLPGASGLLAGLGIVALTALLVWLAGRRLAKELREAEELEQQARQAIVLPPPAEGPGQQPRA